MPTYMIESGDMKETIETAHDIDPRTLCIMAITKAQPKALGLIVSVTGGRFVGENEMFVSTERILDVMGITTPNAALTGERKE